jgi:hypothetical protein
MMEALASHHSKKYPALFAGGIASIYFLQEVMNFSLPKLPSNHVPLTLFNTPSFFVWAWYL